MNFVIGSGPSGVFAAAALLDRNLPVTMIDAGIELEPEKRASVDKLKAQRSEVWDPSLLNQIRGDVRPEFSGLPLKYSYGSDFHVREIEKYILTTTDGPRNYCSLARGGLSNVWGGAILPYSDADLTNWPVSSADMAPYYKKVLDRIPVCAVSDDLAPHFPLYSQALHNIPMSKQASAFLDDLNASKEKLSRMNVAFGKARLAVQAEAVDENPGCVLCGLCMHGCPYGLIYNSTDTLAQLMKNPNFHYVGGVVVENLLETPTGVRVMGRLMANHKQVEYEGAKVFLACGVLNTAKIMLSTMGTYDKSFLIKTSQHFILPLIRFRASADPVSERLHTLSQVFMEIFDPKTPAGNSHLQIYSFNDLYLTLLQGIAGIFYRPFAKLIQGSVLSRILIAQGYLNSRFSPTLEAKLDKSTEKLSVSVVSNPLARKKMKEIVSTLVKLAFPMKAIPLSPLLRVSGGGVGAHIGASFPMSRKPGEFETDLLGRLPRYKSIHIVDASVFTDIPPSTVTLTAMANAYRIASQS